MPFLLASRRFAILFLCLLFGGQAGFMNSVFAQYEQTTRYFGKTDGQWAKERLAVMSLEDKIGQLFMIHCHTSPEHYNRQYVERMISRHGVGGVIFMKGSPMAQIDAVNRFQELSPLPLLVATDAEWGLSMRLDSTMRFPKNMTLGAVRNDTLLYEFGQQLGLQCRAVGVQVNFAPVADVNNNPNNPVINFRSFGEFKTVVAGHAVQMMQGMQNAGVIACAKHFPGHGDTDVDSHLDLPVLDHSRARLDSLELYPFRKLIDEGILSVMTAHLFVPSLDKARNTPASVSYRITRGLLRDSMNFRGLIFTDGLNMAGVTKFYNAGSLELKALMAGNDVLLYSENVPTAIAAIKKAIEQGVLSEAELDQRVYRILLAKEWAGLHLNRKIDPAKAYETLNAPAAQLVKKRLYEEAVTLVKNKYDVLPLKNLERKKIAVVQVGLDRKSEFVSTLQSYGQVDYFLIPKVFSRYELDTLAERLANYTTVVVGLFEMSAYPRNKYGLSDNTFSLLSKLKTYPSDLIVTLFGSPYALKYFNQETAILVAYEEAPEAQEAAAKVIFGGLVPKGRLPVSPPLHLSRPATYTLASRRLGTAMPESQKMDSRTLLAVDSIARHYIKEQVMPGCAVMAVRGGDVVYARGFGKTAYDSYDYISPQNTVYDVASITKVAATTLAIMKLWEEKHIDLNQTLRYYLPEMQGKIGDLKISSLLEHKSGLPAFRQYYHKTMIDNRHDSAFYRTTISDSFKITIKPGLYLRNSFPRQIWANICSIEPVDNPEMVYSDINMIILGKVVESIIREPLEWYLTRHFYEPLGMNNTMFQPALKCSKAQIPPTEEEFKFRFCKIQGFVHDETAALMGGYAGHAGLFTSANDLCKLLLMLKNKGEYGGQRYLKAETIDFFNATQSADNRRGLGWDKPETKKGRMSPASVAATPSAFGHLGFTGCSVWVDPDMDLIYVFLSNRTYPNANNNRFSKENVRILIMDVFYKAIENYQLNAVPR